MDSNIGYKYRVYALAIDDVWRMIEYASSIEYAKAYASNYSSRHQCSVIVREVLVNTDYIVDIVAHFPDPKIKEIPNHDWKTYGF